MKQELLAPAGNLEAGYAAFYYGADAVYLGLRKFSARAGAENFSAEELDELTAYAHQLGRKVYVAINTVIQEDELPSLMEELDVCRKCRVDAVILQDLGVARIIRECYPEIELHASTQMAVHNKEGALFLQQRGFSRVVLARELTQPEIAEIAAIDGLETEAFIHGALCYSYSGLCQFSSLETGRSANRGKCTYPCRSCFKTATGERHVFSMKDMALQKDVLKMPVTSLKIEGRKKSALYVAAVTDYYRRILDGQGEDQNRAENIRQIFSRPWCKFHFKGKNKQVIDPDFVGHRGLKIGKIGKIVKNKIFVTLEHALGRYDGLQIDVPGREKPFGFSVQNLRVNGKNCFSAAVGSIAEVEVPTTIVGLKAGLPVYLASSTAVKGAYPFEKPKAGEFKNTFAVNVGVKVCSDNITAICGKWTAKIGGNFTRADQPLRVEEAFRAAFAKTGGTALSLQALTVENPDGLFVPVSQMNELRRMLYQQIKPEDVKSTLPSVSPKIKSAKSGLIIKTDDVHNLSLLTLSDFTEIIVLINPDMKPKALSSLPKNKVRLALPPVCRNPRIYIPVINAMLDAGYRQWEVANYWGLEILPLERIDLSFDAPLYMFNTQAVEEAKNIGASRITLAIEDTLENMKRIVQKSALPTVVTVYHDPVLFISAACIRDNDCSACDRSRKWLTLEKDGKTYQALSENCQIMLFSGQPLCFIEEIKALNADFYRMDFCYKKYTAEDVCRIVSTLILGKKVPNSSTANINNQKI